MLPFIPRVDDAQAEKRPPAPVQWQFPRVEPSIEKIAGLVLADEPAGGLDVKAEGDGHSACLSRLPPVWRVSSPSDGVGVGSGVEIALRGCNAEESAFCL
jgi:hypothetical protein